MSNKVYDVLKWVALIAIPAASALYVTLSGLWGLPHATEVAGTLAAVGTFMGVLLGVSSSKYQGNTPSGTLHVSENQDIHAAFEKPVADMLRDGRVTMDVKQV